MLSFILNQTEVRTDERPGLVLLEFVRDVSCLSGTKDACREGECGACTVLLDGAPVCSCLVPLAHARGREVRTIESLGGDHPLQRAFVAEGGAQCGACTPGMILAALALPPHPSREQVRRGLAGNLCRCTGYEAIYRAVERAARETGDGAATPARTGEGAP